MTDMEERQIMKKIISALLALLCCSVALLGAGEGFPLAPAKNIVDAETKRNIPFLSNYPDNPVIEGESPTTGLPFSGEYNPVMLVLDNAERAYPHWGVKDADIVLQAPNAGGGATKLLALFSDKIPENAGPSRSGRMPFGQLAIGFGAGFVYAGKPSRMSDYTDFLKALHAAKLPKLTLLSNKSYAKGADIAPRMHNGKMQEIVALFKDKGFDFVQRPFLFNDEGSIEGENANRITIRHFGDEKGGRSNPASESVFLYDAEKKSYRRFNSSGAYTDRADGEEVLFANVIVLRAKLAWYDGYMYFKDFTSGDADIFINGKYLAGGWYRNDDKARFVFVDKDGKEISLKRGKTFIVATNFASEVGFE